MTAHDSMSVVRESTSLLIFCKHNYYNILVGDLQQLLGSLSFQKVQNKLVIIIGSLKYGETREI